MNSGSPAAPAPALPRRLSAAARRQQILETAARLFVERGFESVTVADLAAELQTSRPTIYTYFASTEAILDELLEQRLAELLAQLGPVVSQHRPETAASTLEAVFLHLVAQPDTLKLLHSGSTPTFQARRHAFLQSLGERLSLAPDSPLRRIPDALLLLSTLLDSLALRAVTDLTLDAAALSRRLSVFALAGTQALGEQADGQTV